MPSPLFGNDLARVVYHVASISVGMLIMFCWIWPQKLRFLLDKGTEYPSLGRQGQYTALLISTWGFATLTINGNMTEFYFIGYMLAWSGAQFASVYLKLKGQTIANAATSDERKDSAASPP